MVRWRMAVLLALAIAINYLDRLTLPSVIDQMPKSMAFDKQSFALLNTAFLAAYGAMYLVGENCWTGSGPDGDLRSLFCSGRWRVRVMGWRLVW